jgi:hypothetical protein
MRNLRLVLIAAALLCAVAVAVGGYRLAAPADAPSLGTPVVVQPAATTSTQRASGSDDPAGRPARATSTSARAPSATAVQVSPPPVQDAGDDDPDDEVDDGDGD